MKAYRRIWGKAILSVVVASLTTVVGWSQSLTWLGVLPLGSSSGASGVSADGSVVVGTAENAQGLQRAFRWTASTGMQDLGTLGGWQSGATKVSATGSVIVGWAYTAAWQRRAFRWTLTDPNTGTGIMQSLEPLAGNDSAAFGVSADGTVVVGSTDAVGGVHAFRWTADRGMQDLGVFPWSTRSVAMGVSADGSVVIGEGVWRGGETTIDPVAFRWSATTGLQPITSPLMSGSWAYDVSANGSVVVGVAVLAGEWRAFRWTETDGVQDLGTLGGARSGAYGVSADGSVVVGESLTPTWQPHAFRWTPEGGMEDLNATYADLLLDGSLLVAAYAVSPDGRYIVGWGFNSPAQRSEAFLLDTGFPRRGDTDRNNCVDDADLLRVLLLFGERGYRNEDLNWDGTVDDADLLIVLFNFGSGC